jgi:hypothetical protein
LFLKFAAFYGYVWRNQFKSDDFLAFGKKEWLAGLKPFDDEILNKLTLHCRDHLEFPPTLPQLINLCRKESKRAIFFKAENIEVSLPEVRQRFIGEIKNVLALT